MLFLSLLARPPATSTLFPYTTLFRSGRHGGDSPGLGHWASTETQGDCWRQVVIGDGASAGRGGDGRIERIGKIEDRKSTRLNSSHRCISYAVFCLKKKNTQYQQVALV